MEGSWATNALSYRHSISTISTLEAVMQGTSEVQLLLVDVLEFRQPIECLNATRMIEFGTVSSRAFGYVVFLLWWCCSSSRSRWDFLCWRWILLEYDLIIVLLGLLDQPKHASVVETSVIWTCLLLVVLCSIILPLDFTNVAHYTVILTVQTGIVAVHGISKSLLRHVEFLHIDFLHSIKVHLTLLDTILAFWMEGSFAEILAEECAFRSLAEIAQLAE